MGDKKTLKAFAAFAPLWGWSEDKDERKQEWKDFKANMETFLDQLQDIQETAIEAQKEAWNKIFPKFLEMEDSIAASLPEELPSPVGTVSTKEVVDKVKEFQEKANKNAMEQAETAIEFCKQGQKQARTMVKDTVDTIEEKIEEKAD